jgi:exoribonuclease R
MLKAFRYISSGSFSENDYIHYGLALPFYTHFTVCSRSFVIFDSSLISNKSPIRRYADLVVHRQLLDAISTTPAAKSTELAHTKIEEICENINMRNREAKLASRVGLFSLLGTIILIHAVRILLNCFKVYMCTKR